MTIEKVINEGYCIGCGACKSTAQDVYSIEMTNAGFYKANFNKPLSIKQKEDANKVCPFTDESKNEDEIGRTLFDGLNHDDDIGYYSSIFTGNVINTEERLNSSSGGLTSWFSKKLLEKNLIDAVVHVGQTETMFEYRVSKTIKELENKNNKKSRYYPVNYSELVDYIINTNDRILFVGIPCFVKSIRHLQEAHQLDNIKFVFSLLCGHMKSSAFSEALSWQLGIPPQKLKSTDFRVKKEHHKASDYFIESTDTEGKSSTGRNFSLFGSDWGQGLFKHKACDYCDDIAGELADMSFGDAWLPQYVNDYLGTNIVISRNETLDKLLIEYEYEVAHEQSSISEFVTSQAGNFRHRRDGLRVRVENASSWIPKKRLNLCKVEESEHRKKIYLYREVLSKKSNILFIFAKKLRSLHMFELLIYPYIYRYDQIRLGHRTAIKLHFNKLINAIKRNK